MDKEIWKQVKGYEGYIVSDIGKVVSLKGKNPVQLKPRLSAGRYLAVNLCRQGCVNTVLVRKIVASSFLGIETKGQSTIIINKNGNPLDDSFSNLEVTSRKGRKLKKIKKSKKILVY